MKEQTSVIGFNISKAVKILEQEGFNCIIKEYESKKPVLKDAICVVRQREAGKNTIELTVTGFKTDFCLNK